MTEARKYRTKRRIRIPQLKMREGEEYPVKFIEEWHDEPSREEGKDGNVSIAKVIDLDSGEMKTIVLGAVLKNLLSEDPKGYVGKCYMITCGEQEEGKSWRDYYLDEIWDPEEEESDDPDEGG